MTDREDAELLAAQRSEPRPQKYGVTYFCTDSHGHTYLRYSARHIEPRYTSATVARRPGTDHPVTKACVNYASHRTDAEAVARGWNKAPNWAAEVVPVRAYRGRWTVGREPARQWALTQGEAR